MLIPKPQPVSEFFLIVPSMEPITIFAQQTSLPKLSTQTFSVKLLGKDFKIPYERNWPGGEFSCLLPEDSSGLTAASVLLHQYLHGIKAVKRTYSKIVVGPTIQGSIPNPISTFVLYRAYLSSVDEVSFDASSAETALKYKLTFSYAYAVPVALRGIKSQ